MDKMQLWIRWTVWDRDGVYHSGWLVERDGSVESQVGRRLRIHSNYYLIAFVGEPLLGGQECG